MKILHIIPSLAKGGAERLVTDIVRELSLRKGIDVRLVILNNTIEYDIKDIKHLVQYIPAKVKLSVWRKNKYEVEELQAFIDSFQPNIIHSHLFEAEIVSRSCIYPEAKWFSHCHNNMQPFQKLSARDLLNKKRLTQWYERFFLFNRYKKNGKTNFIAISKDTLDYINDLKTAHNPSFLLPNAIDFKKFENENTKSLDKLKLVNVGSFQKIKNQSFLVKVAKELLQRDIDVELTFLGDGKEKQKVENLVRQEKLEQHISFEGNVNNVEDYLSKSNIYIHASTRESFGLVLIEAMASGLPVITLDGGGNKDIIENGQNGYIFKEQDSGVFAEKIIEVISDKEKYQKMSNFAVKFAEKYDIKNYINQLTTIYQINH